jgi:diguanylate cyclase (GGDEF)-like protein
MRAEIDPHNSSPNLLVLIGFTLQLALKISSPSSFILKKKPTILTGIYTGGSDMRIINIPSALKACYLAFITLAACAVQNSVAADSRQIFILDSYSHHYPWTKVQHDSFESTVNDGSLGAIAFQTEQLDTKRVNYDAQYKESFTEYLIAKYKGYKPDLIYVTDDDALDFVSNHLPDTFGSVPVIFSGINNFELIGSLDPNRFVGVFEKKEIAPNLELLGALDKNVRDVVVVGDGSTTYDAIKREMKKALATQSKISAHYIADQNLDRVLSQLKERNEKYLILTTIGGMVSSDEKVASLDEVLTRIVDLKKFIIISMEDSYMHEGVFGGYLADGSQQGKQAGLLANAYLSGRPISSLSMITDHMNTYVFDHRLLEKYAFTLPEHIADVAKITHLPISWYDRYRSEIGNLLVSLVIVISVLLASFVWVLSRKNRQIMSRTKLLETKESLEIERLQKVERFQDALVELSRGHFESLTDEFGHVAKISSETLCVKQVGVWLYNDDRTGIVCHAIYHLENGFGEAGVTLNRTDYPSYFNAVDTGKMLAIHDAQTDPITAELTDGYLIPNNISSMLDVPIFYQGECMGVVCHEHIGDQRDWSLDEQEFAYAVAKNVSLSLEISKRKEIETVLEHQAYHDALTNLPNRTLLVDRLNQAILQASRNDTIVAILFFDLDNFKIINDSFGHIVGDKVLVTVSQLLKEKFRGMDTVARIGGDEFVMILHPFETVDQVTTTTASICELLQAPIEIDGHELYATASIGVSVYPNDGSSAEALIKNADAAMYHAKEGGRNSFQFYAQEMTDKAMARITIGTALRKAVVNEEFVVHYQPQYDVTLKKLVGFEALVRWQHPERGLVSPYEFIGVAEEIGLIVDIDRYVMQASLSLFKQWRQQGLDVGVLSLNLSMRQLEQDDFFTEVSRRLEEHDFRPEWLGFEVTEGSIMKNPQKAIRLLEKLSALGISIAIDDFGTGYSSLEYLKRLPVDKLKIDRSFVKDVLEDEGDALIIQAVIALSRSLKLNVIAEGVEEPGQMDFLIKNGCSEVQGYLYGKPMDVASIEKSLGDMINFDLDLSA